MNNKFNNHLNNLKMEVTDFTFTHTHDFTFDFTFDIDLDVYDEDGNIVTETITDTDTVTVRHTTLSEMKNGKIVKTSFIDKGKIVESEDSKKPNEIFEIKQ